MANALPDGIDELERLARAANDRGEALVFGPERILAVCAAVRAADEEGNDEICSLLERAEKVEFALAAALAEAKRVKSFCESAIEAGLAQMQRAELGRAEGIEAAARICTELAEALPDGQLTEFETAHYIACRDCATAIWALHLRATIDAAMGQKETK